MSAGPGFVVADLLERSITRPLLDFFANISDLCSRYWNGDFFTLCHFLSICWKAIRRPCHKLFKIVARFCGSLKGVS